MQLLRQENKTYKIKERKIMQTPKTDKYTQTTHKKEAQTIDKIGGRKRRRIKTQEPETSKYDFYLCETEPQTSEGEQKYTEIEEDTCSNLIREYKRAAKISHKKTKTAIVSAKKILKEIEETTDNNKTKIENSNTGDTTIQNVLKEIRIVIDKHLNKTEQTTKK